jgi:hypothetical protein
MCAAVTVGLLQQIWGEGDVSLGKETEMVKYGRKADQAWGMLADLEEEERRTMMLQRYRELAPLPEEERVNRLLMMADAENELPKDKLRTFTLSRLNVWLMLEPEVARRISDSFDAAMRKIPGLQTTRWLGLAKTLAKEFPTEERERLIALIPAVFGGVDLVEPAPAKKRWWHFGKR